jgi:hypothetical protein
MTRRGEGGRGLEKKRVEEFWGGRGGEGGRINIRAPGRRDQ